MHTMKHSHYEILYALCMAMEWAADAEAVYERLVDVAAEYLECDAVHLHLLDIDGKTFVRRADYFDEMPRSYMERTLSADVGRMRALLESGDLIVMEDYEHPHAEDEIPEVAIELGFHSGISIPLSSSSGVLGLLTVVYRAGLPWTEGDWPFLLELGKVLGVLVERVQMSKKEVELKVLRDRKQLSSEIHDNVSQMASALAIRADIALSCLDGGDVDALAGELENVADQARQVTKVLREEMLSLRTSIDGAGDVEESLAEALSWFENQWGIPVRLESRCQGEVHLSKFAHLQLSRIVNECLQNVLRHSRATKVDVTFDCKNGNVLISIRDDGIGFDVDAVPDERLGLRIMRERANSAGGSASIASGSQGTTVFIDLPAFRT